MTKEPQIPEDIKRIMGKPQFRNTVMYAYNRSRHSFIFYVPMGDGSKELLPIGQYQPLISEEMPYDASEIVDDIADLLSRDIELNDNSQLDE